MEHKKRVCYTDDMGRQSKHIQDLPKYIRTLNWRYFLWAFFLLPIGFYALALVFFQMTSEVSSIELVEILWNMNAEPLRIQQLLIPLPWLVIVWFWWQAYTRSTHTKAVVAESIVKGMLPFIVQVLLAVTALFFAWVVLLVGTAMIETSSTSSLADLLLTFDVFVGWNLVPPFLFLIVSSIFLRKSG